MNIIMNIGPKAYPKPTFNFHIILIPEEDVAYRGY